MEWQELFMGQCRNLKYARLVRGEHFIYPKHEDYPHSTWLSTCTQFSNDVSFISVSFRRHYGRIVYVYKRNLFFKQYKICSLRKLREEFLGHFTHLHIKAL